MILYYFWDIYEESYLILESSLKQDNLIWSSQKELVFIFL